MFEFSVGEKEIHKVKFTFSKFAGICKVFIDDNLYRQWGILNGGSSQIALEVGKSEKHFVYLQLFGSFYSSYNIDVFIDNKFLGNFILK